ncbi:hypothetical protein DHW03_15375 [Pedobacter yonginense]|uniref:Uncharacterized protein n=1 Tax=Pedobacter yonginense TaxID=651869 RepID=A0A317EHW1_9SPHI|nr:hypothetical protein [Pedobacter yonginense]PWS26174.1 hypothetical protein DHW03_15375 [Pedobacter yonginense]
MSNIGLNTNVFRITGKYLDILNDFIVRAKIHSEISESKKKELIEFLTKINDTENAQPQFQLLSSIIERELRNSHKRPVLYLNSLMEEIRDGALESVVPKIEFIVEALDTENSEALSKIKGD